MVPAKTNLTITNDIRGMRDLAEDANLHRQQWETKKGLVKTIGVAGFRTFEEYRDPKRKRAEPDPINAVMVTCWDGYESLAYRTDQGEQIAEECIRRYRMKTMLAARHKCMIVCGEHYAIFDLEELMMLVGQPVRRPMRTQEEAFRRIHGL